MSFCQIWTGGSAPWNSNQLFITTYTCSNPPVQLGACVSYYYLVFGIVFDCIFIAKQAVATPVTIADYNRCKRSSQLPVHTFFFNLIFKENWCHHVWRAVKYWFINQHQLMLRGKQVATRRSKELMGDQYKQQFSWLRIERTDWSTVSLENMLCPTVLDGAEISTEWSQTKSGILWWNLT